VLTIYRTECAPQRWAPGDAPRSSGQILWVDLLDPDEAERDTAAALLGASLPTRDQISALELSSRLRADSEMLRLNVPAFIRDDHGHGATTPLAFVLTPKLLVCIRYAESAAFDAVAKSLGGEAPPKTSIDVFVDLVEAIVNVDADRMEAIAGDLSKLARAVFSDTQDHRHQLKSALFQVGAMQREIIQIRSTQLGISRMLSYLCDSEHTWITEETHAELKMTHKDVEALAEFDQQLSDRLEFLLDAVLGFINNTQNDIMKVLTVITVVTIPPMILAGIWEMNFKTIPEYGWSHGYAFGLSMIVVSMLIPLAILKWKKWF
jgi:magnesium transporter